MIDATDRLAPGTAHDERQGWLFCVSGASIIRPNRDRADAESIVRLNRDRAVQFTRPFANNRSMARATPASSLRSVTVVAIALTSGSA